MNKIIINKILTNNKYEIYKYVPKLIISTALEIVTLGALYPFILILIDYEKMVSKFGDYLNISQISRQELLSISSLSMILLILTSLIIRTKVTKEMFDLIYKIGLNISIELFDKQIKQKYSYYQEVSPPEIYTSINNALQLTHKVISPVVQSLAHSVQAVSIIILILVLNKEIAVPSILGFSFIYYIISILTKKKLREESIKINAGDHTRSKIMHEVVSGIKTVIIENSFEKYEKSYSIAEKEAYLSRGKSDALAVVPRYVVETAVILLIIIIANVSLSTSADQATMLATLGILAIGVQKLIPSVQVMYHAWASVEGSHALLTEVSKDLNKSEIKYPKKEGISQNKTLNSCIVELKNVKCSYKNNIIIKNANLKIEKSKSIAIIGKTGSGKSTLIDAILGLKEISNGSILVDGKFLTNTNKFSWLNCVAYISQFIYLKNESVLNNVVGESNFAEDRDKAFKVLKIAEYDIEKHEQLDQNIGDNGSRLSGGQRQRLAIARALYKDKQVLILDESTSAIDEATEVNIIKNIKSTYPEKTIITITHRTSTLKYFDQIIIIENGELNVIDQSGNCL